MWRLSWPILVFWLFIRTFIGIVALFIIAVALHLTEVLLIFLVLLVFLIFLNSGYINSCCWSVVLVALASSTAMRILLWPSSGLVGLDYLSTSISRTGRRELFTLDIFLNIFTPDRLITSCTSTIYFFYQRRKLLSSLSLSINCFFDGFLLII